jgi:TldD protein
MTTPLSTDLIPQVAPMVRDLVTSRSPSRPHLRYADVRLEAIQGKYAAAENGDSKGAGEDAILGFGVRVLAGAAMIAPGYFGRGLGEADIPHLERILAEGIDAAYRRAAANAEWKAQVRGKFGGLGESLSDTRLHPVRVCRDTVPAIYEVDPRAVDLGEMVRFTRDVSRRVLSATTTSRP